MSLDTQKVTQLDVIDATGVSRSWIGTVALAVEDEGRKLTVRLASVLFCNFCGKSQHEVKRLVSGPAVFICDECVDLCKEIICEAGA